MNLLNMAIYQANVVIAEGRFKRIRQVAQMSPPMRAHWRNLANTIELVLPSAHPTDPSS